MMRKLDKFYLKLAKDMSRGYLQFGDTSVAQVFTNAEPALESILLTQNRKTAGIAGNWQFEQLEKGRKSATRIKRINELIASSLASFLEENAIRSVFITVGTARNHAANIIGRAIADGAGQNEISKLLLDSFRGDAPGGRSFGAVQSARIARTEVGIVGSKGQDEGAREIGADQKLWVTVRDARARAHHSEVDGIRVGLDDFFTPDGQNMLHPHDTENGATPGNFINCRCVVLYE